MVGKEYPMLAVIDRLRFHHVSALADLSAPIRLRDKQADRQQLFN